MVLASGLLSGAEVALVIEIHAVSDGVKAVLFAEGFHDSEEFVFAMEATGCVIASIFGALKLGRWNDLKRNALLLGEGGRIRQLCAREAG